MTDAFKHFAERAEQHPTHPPIGYQDAQSLRDYPRAAPHHDRPEINLIEDRDWQGVCLTVAESDMDDGQWIMAENAVAVER